MNRILATAVAVIAIDCSGNSDSSSPPPSPPGFTGTYATQVTLAQNTCGTITVQSLPTVVTHSVASGAITIVHGATTYSGSVAADSTFTTVPRDVNVGDGFQYRINITGRFGNRSFVADVAVDRSGSGTPCQFVAHWVGSR